MQFNTVFTPTLLLLLLTSTSIAAPSPACGSTKMIPGNADVMRLNVPLACATLWDVPLGSDPSVLNTKDTSIGNIDHPREKLFCDRDVNILYKYHIHSRPRNFYDVPMQDCLDMMPVGIQECGENDVEQKPSDKAPFKGMIAYAVMPVGCCTDKGVYKWDGKKCVKA